MTTGASRAEDVAVAFVEAAEEPETAATKEETEVVFVAVVAHSEETVAAVGEALVATVATSTNRQVVTRADRCPSRWSTSNW